jgi:superfamily II DNA or RNA helicase
MLETLKVRKINHSSLIIDADSSASMELSEFFSFFVPGYKFMPAFRNRMWDGKIRLYNARAKQLPAGLYHHLAKFAKERGYQLEPEKTEYGWPNDKIDIDPQQLMNFIHSISLPFDIRDYQFNAVAYGLENKRAILVSPTGSGKSLIIYVLLRYFLEENENQKVLVVVPTTSLVEQMYNDFKDYGMLVENNCHRIYSGKDKETEKHIIISTWQSIYKLSHVWFEQFGMVIGDECHGFKSKSLTSIMDKCTEAMYRFGTTGTLDGTQTHELVLQGLFGKTHRVTTTKNLQDNDTLAKLEISRIVIEYDDDIRKSFGKKSYQDEIDYIVKNEKRNKFIRNLALDQKGNTLVLFQFVEKHGKILHDLIDNAAHKDRRIFFVSGATETSDREAIRKIVEKQKDAIIVASLGTFSTGINIKNIHNIIFASPSKSQIRVLQSIGRGLRKSDNNAVTKLFDITDDISWETRKNFALIHSFERLRIYKNENFQYKTFKVTI